MFRSWLLMVFVRTGGALLPALAGCSVAEWQPELPALDARWVGSLYHGCVGQADLCLERINDLVDSGQIEVLGRDARSVVMPGRGPEAALVLAGKPEALALAHQRIAGQGRPGGQMRGVIGVALSIPGPENGTSGPMLSVVLLPALDGLDEVLARIRDANPNNWVSAFPEFRSGRSTREAPRTLLVVEANAADLRQLTHAMHETGIRCSGFLGCQFSHLWSAPF